MLFIVSEVYYPEEAGTAHYMTGIADGLAKGAAVRVICAKPKYDRRWEGLPTKENHNGVQIHRCWATTFDKNHLGGRIANVYTASFSIFFAILRMVRKGDKVLVVTSPPLLPFVVAVACCLRGAKWILRIDDVYPEAMIHAGILRPGGIAARFIDWMNRTLYRRTEKIIVIGRDMKRLVEKKLGGRNGPILLIPNWADVDSVVPCERCENRLLRELGLERKFVVGYAGNIGRVQGVEALFATALRMKELDDVQFLFVGSGQKTAWLKQAIAGAQLKNITLVGQRPRSEQSDFLNSCDIAVVPLVRGMGGAGVPSRLYNVMAAGKPVIASVDHDSETALVVREQDIGWVVAPEEPAEMARAIIEARSAPDRLAEMGRRARKVAEDKYSRPRILAQYQHLLLSQRPE
jgi:glycosyltransferase involved in cell wall biosynthesis